MKSVKYIIVSVLSVLVISCSSKAQSPTPETIGAMSHNGNAIVGQSLRDTLSSAQKGDYDTAGKAIKVGKDAQEIVINLPKQISASTPQQLMAEKIASAEKAITVLAASGYKSCLLAMRYEVNKASSTMEIDNIINKAVTTQRDLAVANASVSGWAAAWPGNWHWNSATAKAIAASNKEAQKQMDYAKALEVLTKAQVQSKN